MGYNICITYYELLKDCWIICSGHLQTIGISIILQQQPMEKNLYSKTTGWIRRLHGTIQCSHMFIEETSRARCWEKLNTFFYLNCLLLWGLLDYSRFHIIPLRQSPGFSPEARHLTRRSSFLKIMAKVISSLLDLWVKAPNREVEFLFTVEEVKQVGCPRS